MSDWAKRAQDDGHLRLKAARKLGSWPGNDDTGIPVILCGEWTDAQVKAFRILVNRSFAWAEFDDGLLSLKRQDLVAADFDLSLTGFDPRELDPVSRPGDLWLAGNRRNQHRIFIGDAIRPERWRGCWLTASPARDQIRRMESPWTPCGGTAPA